MQSVRQTLSLSRRRHDMQEDKSTLDLYREAVM